MISVELSRESVEAALRLLRPMRATAIGRLLYAPLMSALQSEKTNSSP